MNKPTYQQPSKNPGKPEGQTQKPAPAGDPQPFYKADRDPVISKDTFEGPAKSPQKQASQSQDDALNRKPKNS